MSKLPTRREVLDKGYVILHKVNGTELDIVNAARVSYQTTKETFDDVNDKKLLRFLLRHDHGSPFEFVDYVFEIHLPIFVMRQLVRHRIMSLNEWSGRYTELPDNFYLPDEDLWRTQSKSNKQGSEGTLNDEEGAVYTRAFGEEQRMISMRYKEALKAGIAKELARINLPVSTYTLCRIKINARSLFNLLRLRMDEHAQLEIREYADAMYELVKDQTPILIEAFDDYIRNAVNFSAQEMEVVRKAITIALESNSELLTEAQETLTNKREYQEFLKKIGLK